MRRPRRGCASGCPSIARPWPGLRDALEVWSYVQSLPEPGLAILTMGKRDVSYDQHLPFPRMTFRPGTDAAPRALPDGYEITALNDQHAFMRTPAAHGLAVGEHDRQYDRPSVHDVRQVALHGRCRRRVQRDRQHYDMVLTTHCRSRARGNPAINTSHRSPACARTTESL